MRVCAGVLATLSHTLVSATLAGYNACLCHLGWGLVGIAGIVLGTGRNCTLVVCHAALEATQSELFELKNKYDEEAAAKYAHFYPHILLPILAHNDQAHPFLPISGEPS